MGFRLAICSRWSPSTGAEHERREVTIEVWTSSEPGFHALKSDGEKKGVLFLDSDRVDEIMEVG